jgi:hypothetical protein
VGRCRGARQFVLRNHGALSHPCLTRSISLDALDSKIYLVEKLWGVFSFHQSYTPPQFMLLRDNDILVDSSRCGEVGFCRGIERWAEMMTMVRACESSINTELERACKTREQGPSRRQRKPTTAWRHTPRAHPRSRIFVFVHLWAGALVTRAPPRKRDRSRSFLICELAPPHELLADRAS